MYVAVEVVSLLKAVRERRGQSEVEVQAWRVRKLAKSRKRMYGCELWLQVFAPVWKPALTLSCEQCHGVLLGCDRSCQERDAAEDRDFAVGQLEAERQMVAQKAKKRVARLRHVFVSEVCWVALTTGAGV